MLGVLLVAAAPGPGTYEDTKSRFTLDLPRDWKLAPRFGDTFGMTFERALEGQATTALTVHVDPAIAQDLAGFAVAAEKAWQSAGPITMRSTSRVKVADRPALVHDADQAGRRIKAYFLESDGHYYHLRFEVPPGQARTVEADWEKMVASFRPGASAPKAADPKLPPSIPPGLMGSWRGKAGVAMTLRPDRTFAMGGLKGRWSIDGASLVLVVPGRSPLRFTMVLDGDVLELSTPNLEAPVRYDRAAPEDTSLAGTWRSTSGTTLVLSKSGHFEMGDLAGQWEDRDERLSLRGDGGAEEVTYRYSLADGVLTLAGGDLEAPLVLKRAKK